MRFQPKAHTRHLALAVCFAVIAVIILRSTACEEVVTGPPVIGGTTARGTGYKYLAYIVDRNIGQCTGTVVQSRLVLTAGHCVAEPRLHKLRDPSRYVVYTQSLSTGVRVLRRSLVTQVIVFPAFRDNIFAPDAALLVLAHPITTPIVGLTPRSPRVANRESQVAAAQIVGWATNYGERAIPDEVRTASTEVQTGDWCAMHMPRFTARTELCTLASAPLAAATCYGDSGGPLIAAVGLQRNPTQIGIATRSPDHCSARSPSVFVKLSAIRVWLRREIRKYS